VYLVSDFLLQYSVDGSVSHHILSEMIVCECLHMAKLTPKSYVCYRVVFSISINDPHHTHIRRCMYYNTYVVMFSPVRIKLMMTRFMLTSYCNELNSRVQFIM